MHPLAAAPAAAAAPQFVVPLAAVLWQAAELARADSWVVDHKALAAVVDPSSPTAALEAAQRPPLQTDALHSQARAWL